MADSWDFRLRPLKAHTMKFFVFPLALMLLIELIITGINKALAPYTEAFWDYGLLASLVFISLFWGSALDTRLHRMEQTPSKRIDL